MSSRGTGTVAIDVGGEDLLGVLDVFLDELLVGFPGGSDQLEQDTDILGAGAWCGMGTQLRMTLSTSANTSAQSASTSAAIRRS